VQPFYFLLFVGPSPRPLCEAAAATRIINATWMCCNLFRLATAAASVEHVRGIQCMPESSSCWSAYRSPTARGGGLVVLLLMLPILIWRLPDEKRFLRQNLQVYTEYQGKVKYLASCHSFGNEV
jgi:protein-S-isoprenylcysteine O-methyltransferase Ste14